MYSVVEEAAATGDALDAGVDVAGADGAAGDDADAADEEEEADSRKHS